MKPKVAIIVALGKNREIGIGDQLLGHFPSDMKFFKEQTTGQTVVMGRKTYDSLPDKFRPLPNRKTVIVSRTLPADVTKFSNVDWVDEITKLPAYIRDIVKTQYVYIAGGASIYEQSLQIGNFIDEIYMTAIPKNFPEATHFFPLISWENFCLSDVVELPGDERLKLFKFYRY